MASSAGKSPDSAPRLAAWRAIAPRAANERPSGSMTWNSSTRPTTSRWPMPRSSASATSSPPSQSGARPNNLTARTSGLTSSTGSPARIAAISTGSAINASIPNAPLASSRSSAPTTRRPGAANRAACTRWIGPLPSRENTASCRRAAFSSAVSPPARCPPAPTSSTSVPERGQPVVSKRRNAIAAISPSTTTWSGRSASGAAAPPRADRVRVESR